MSAQTVWLRDYPVRLGADFAEHVEDWMREFRLMSIAASASDDGAPQGHEVPERLQAMAQYITRTYATELSEPDRLRAAAAARGDLTVDLPYPVVPETRATVLAWQQLLADVDGYCAAQELLTLQRTAEQVELCDWLCAEFVRQIDGAPPQPWRFRPTA